MKKILYIAPVLRVKVIGVEKMIAVSGPQTSDNPANQDIGMDVKSDRGSSYNVWNDDWSK